MMKHYRYRIQYVARNHPKVLVGLIAFVFVAVGAGFAVGAYAVQKAATLASNQAKTWEPEVTRNLTELPAQASVFVEAVVLRAASGWLMERAASGEVASVTHGLSCFDAIGGPSPTEILNHARRISADKSLDSALHRLNQTLDLEMPSPKGASACAQWLVGS